jgi:hypothetical protein
MKPWLRAIGRACIEFPILLVLMAFISGLSTSLSSFRIESSSFALNIGLSALELMPFAVVITLFLSFFSFDSTVRSRSFGYLGLLLIGALGLAGEIALNKIPLAESALQNGAAQSAAELPPPSVAYNNEGTALWYRSVQGDTVTDVVAIDFSAPFPRLKYGKAGVFDSKYGTVTVDRHNYWLAPKAVADGSLFPEAAPFEGSLIWDRLASLAEAPLARAAIAAGGFLILVLGFRFIARLTAWPLANAMLAISAVVGLLAGDAALSGLGAVPISVALSRVGVTLDAQSAVAAVESILGLLLIGLDLLLAPRRPSEAE